MERRETYALVAPLIMTATGEKMGKTVAGAVWLDPARTSAYDYYQYWINVDDPDVERFLALFTFLPMDDVRDLGRREGADLRASKERLAFEATALAHGVEEAEKAQTAARALFSGDGEAASAPTTLVPRARFDEGIKLVDLLVETGLASSKRAASDLIKQGGAYVNSMRMGSPEVLINYDSVQNGAVLLRAGKKRFPRVVPE
jgi:tyrosyl-tRNA synthetase